jgi:outer membrane protein
MMNLTLPINNKQFMKKAFLLIFLNILPITLPLIAQSGKSWSLQECIEYALDQNIQVRKSDLSNQSFQYYAAQAKAQRFPSVSADITQSFSWSKDPTDASSSYSGANGTNYQVNSSVNLFNANRTNNQIKQAELDIKGGQYSLETTKESISLSILDAFLQVLYAEEQVKNSEKQIESTTSQLNLASERLILQVISQADYAQVKSQLASEKLNLANAQSQLAIAKVNLEQLMELPVSDSFNIQKPNLEEALGLVKTPEVRSIYDTALAIKPQIKYAAVNKQIAALDEKIAKADYYPSLSARAGVSSNYSGITNSAYFNQLNNGILPSISFGLSIPIYQKRQVKTNVEIAKIGFRNAELSELDTRNQLRKNIEQACQDVVSAQSKYEANHENFTATQEAAALSDEKFKQGIINSVDYLVSKTNLIVAESQLLQAKYNLIFSYKILDFYTGIPLSL